MTDARTPQDVPVLGTFGGQPAADVPRGMRVAAQWIAQIQEARYGVPPDREETQRIIDDCFRDRPCNDCGAAIGQPHDHGCHVERCQYTGVQWIACGGMSDWNRCDCEDDNGYDPDGYTVHTCGQRTHDCGSETWDGVWPGYEECVEFGDTAEAEGPNGTIRRELTGTSHLHLSIDFKPGKRALWTKDGQAT